MANPITFTPELVSRTPDIGRVLAEMMDNQIDALEADLRQRFKKESLRPGLVLKILSSFVTEDDTRQPRSHEQLGIPGYPEAAVDYCVEQLKASRILKDYGEGTYELTHDTLAKHLARQRDEETANIIEIVKAVRGGFNIHQLDKKQFLGPYTLANLEKFEDIIRKSARLSEAEWKFVRASKRDVARKKRKQRLRLIVLSFIAILMTLTTLVTLVLWNHQSSLSKTLEENNESQRRISQAMQAQRIDRTAAWDSLASSSGSKIDPELQNNFTATLGNVFDFLFSQLDSNEQTKIMRDQMKTQLVQEYPLAPIYNRGDQINAEIDQMIIDPASRFYCMVTKQGRDQLLFRSFAEDGTKTGTKYLFKPPGNPRYQATVDIIQIPGTSQLLTIHEDGKIFLTNPLDTLNPGPDSIAMLSIDDGWVPADLEPFQGGALIGAGRGVWRLYLDGRKKPLQWVIGFDDPVDQVKANPANISSFAVTKKNSPELVICDAEKPSEERIDTTFKFSYGPVTQLAFAPNGKSIFTAFEGELGIFWTFKDPQIHTLFRGHAGMISDVKFSPDGRKIITSSWDKKVILWNISGKKIKELIGHKGRVLNVAFFDENFLVSADENGKINYWYVGNLAEKEESLSERIRAFACSPDGSKVAYSYYGQDSLESFCFWVWDWTKDTIERHEQYLRKYDNHGGISSLAFSPDGKAVLSGSDNRLTSLVYLEGSSRPENYFPDSKKNIPVTSSISSVDINEDYVLIANRKNGLENGKIITDYFALIRSRKKDLSYVLKHEGDMAGINVAHFLPGRDSLLLTGCDDGNVYIWNFLRATPEVVDTLSGHSSRISSCAVSEKDNSRFILVGSKDNTAKLWVWDAKEQRYSTSGVLFEDLIGTHNTYAWHASDITSVDLINEIVIDTSPTNGEKKILSIGKILTASEDGTVKLWSLKGKSGKRVVEVPTIIHHSGAIRAAHFSSDGKFILTGGDDGRVKAWDIASGAEDKIKQIRKREPIILK